MTDKNEDGGRARLLEEGLVHFVFRYGKDNDFFDSKTDARVTSSILNAIEVMFRGMRYSIGRYLSGMMRLSMPLGSFLR